MIKAIKSSFKDLKNLELLLLFVLTAYCLKFVWFNFPIVQVDLMGHIRSAQDFWDLGFHSWNLHYHNGLIQNLFYPPLNDFCLGLVIKLFQAMYGSEKFVAAIVATKFYISIWLVLTVLAYWQLRSVFTESSQRLFMTIAFFLFFILDKNELADSFLFKYFPFKGHLNYSHAGLSFSDLMILGSLPQFVSFSGFLILLKRLLKQDFKNLKFPMIFLVCTHLVSAMVAAFLVSSVWLAARKDDKIEILKEMLIALVLSCFFWLPFLLFKSEMSTFSIPSMDGLFLHIFAVFFLIVFVYFRRDRVVLPVVTVATALVIYDFFYQYQIWNWAAFHTYRFFAYAIFIWLVGSAFLMSRRQLRLGVIAVWICFWTYNYFGYFVYNLEFINQPAVTNAVNEGFIKQNLIRKENGIERIHVVNVFRPRGSEWETYFSQMQPKNYFTHGLFAEAYKGNLLLDLALYSSTNSNQSNSGESVEQLKLDCQRIRCLRSQLYQDFAISKIILPQVMSRYMKRSDSLCLYYNLMDNQKLLGTFNVGPVNYTYFDNVGNRIGNFISTQQVFEFSQIRHIGQAEEYEKVNQFACSNPEKSIHAYVEKEVMQSFKKAHFTEVNSKVEPIEEKVSLNRIDFESNQFPLTEPTLVFARISKLPGISFRNSQNDELPSWPAYNGSLIQTKGQFSAVYKRPAVFIVGYLISIVGAILFGLAMISRRNRAKETKTREL